MFSLSLRRLRTTSGSPPRHGGHRSEFPGKRQEAARRIWMYRLRRPRPIRRCRNARLTDGPHSRQVGEQCDVAFGRGISAELRSAILEHDELSCRMCGTIPGDIDELTGRRVRFNIGRISPKRLGGKDEVSNMRVLCSTCHRGAKELIRKGTSDNRPLSQVLLDLFGANRR
jgi:5-methylcytosine-specific restriction endonuclease McrA